MCRLTRVVLPSAAAGFCVARSQISVSAAVTALLANRINFASQNASQNSVLSSAGSTCKSKTLRVKAGERENVTPTKLLARCQGFPLYKLE